MLTSLFIRNYVLIDQLEIQFSSGLSTITGETGSGKSIILGALGLILGDRADAKAVKKDQTKCIIEGSFDLTNLNLAPLFEELDLDYENISVFRREININGKSRAFINDTPVNLVQLKELSLRLIDIHSQHQTLQVNSSEFQLKFIDAFAKSGGILAEYQKVFTQYQKARSAFEKLLEAEKESKSNLDYYAYQYQELSEANLDSIDMESLEEELNFLDNAEEVKQVLAYTTEVLSESELNILSALRDVKARLGKISTLSKTYGELTSRISSSLIELEDIAAECENLANSGEMDPGRQEMLRNKLDEIYRLQTKHSVSSLEELKELREEFAGRISTSESLEEEIVQAEKKLGELKASLLAIGEKLSVQRKKAVKPLQSEIENILASLNMKDARIQLEFTALQEPSPMGLNRIKILFQSNKGSRFDELKNVASGGELSRLMLAIKSIMARVGGTATIVFDEIDTGVSGEVAQKMGEIMQNMGKEMQVLCITHLPQIAARGAQHFKVSKDTSGKVTQTRIVELSAEDRTWEIAQMLSGEKATEAAVANARELLQLN